VTGREQPSTRRHPESRQPNTGGGERPGRPAPERLPPGAWAAGRRSHGTVRCAPASARCLRSRAGGVHGRQGYMGVRRFATSSAIPGLRGTRRRRWPSIRVRRISKQPPRPCSQRTPAMESAHARPGGIEELQEPEVLLARKGPTHVPRKVVFLWSAHWPSFLPGLGRNRLSPASRTYHFESSPPARGPQGRVWPPAWCVSRGIAGRAVHRPAHGCDPAHP